jgi:hypothetical protein
LASIQKRRKERLKRDVCAPESIHHAIVRAFQASIEAGIFDSQSGEASEDREELHIAFLKLADFFRIDSHDPDSFATDLKGNAEDGDKAFDAGGLFILKAFINAYIGNIDRRALHSLFINGAIYDIDRAFSEVTAAEAADGAHLKIAGGGVEEAQGTALDLHSFRDAGHDTLEDLIKFETRRDRQSGLIEGSIVILLRAKRRVLGV